MLRRIVVIQGHPEPDGKGLCRALAGLSFRLRRRQLFCATYDRLGILERFDALEFLLDEAPYPRAGIFGWRRNRSHCQSLGQAAGQGPRAAQSAGCRDGHRSSDQAPVTPTAPGIRRMTSRLASIAIVLAWSER